jgi:hypothetical protein
MPDVKISGLPASTTPLAGTEVLPIVQSGVTKQVSIANVTSGRPVASTGYQLESGGLITEATTARTLSATDNGKIIYCTSGSATTITCAAGLGAGFSVTIIQGGAGKVTVAAGGQTLVSYSSLISTMGQNAVISLICPVANTFVAAGNLGL